MKKIMDKDVIRDIKSKDIELLKKDDNIIRDAFHILFRVEDKYFIKVEGNVSPRKLGEWWKEISKSKANELLSEDIEIFADHADRIAVDCEE
jgi:hypothetical protein